MFQKYNVFGLPYSLVSLLIIINRCILYILHCILYNALDVVTRCILYDLYYNVFCRMQKISHSAHILSLKILRLSSIIFLMKYSERSMLILLHDNVEIKQEDVSEATDLWLFAIVGLPLTLTQAEYVVLRGGK